MSFSRHLMSCTPSSPCNDCKKLLPSYAYDGSRGKSYRFEWTDCGNDNCAHRECALIDGSRIKSLHEAVMEVKFRAQLQAELDSYNTKQAELAVRHAYNWHKWNQELRVKAAAHNIRIYCKSCDNQVGSSCAESCCPLVNMVVDWK